jgi:hypothetical protein
MTPRRTPGRLPPTHSARRVPPAPLVGLAQLMLWAMLIAGWAGTVRAQTPSDGPVQVLITRPQPGEQIPSTEVLVALATSGAVTVGPPVAGAWPPPGEFHILLDGVDVLQTAQLQFSIQPVAPGPHTLRAELQDWPGGPASPAEVAFTVTPAPPPTGSTWWLAGTVAAVAVVLLISLSLLWLRWVRPVQAAPLYDEADEESTLPEDKSPD